nr:hypothetical protein [Tanacetum cinerariifolium]
LGLGFCVGKSGEGSEVVVERQDKWGRRLTRLAGKLGYEQCWFKRGGKTEESVWDLYNISPWG